MTAVLRSVELFIPGTIQSTEHSHGFHVLRTAPQVTDAVRRRIAAEITSQQKTWSMLIVAGSFIFGVLMAYSARQHGIEVEIRREGLRPILIATAVLLGYLHLYFTRQRLFVMTAPATFAEVVEERGNPDEYDRRPSITPRLAICYTPLPPGESDSEFSMLDGPCAPPAWADLEGFAEHVEPALHPGDQVAVLYDPIDPAHVRIIET
jgi:hypothetical protein